MHSESLASFTLRPHYPREEIRRYCTDSMTEGSRSVCGKKKRIPRTVAAVFQLADGHFRGEVSQLAMACCVNTLLLLLSTEMYTVSVRRQGGEKFVTKSSTVCTLFIVCANLINYYIYLLQMSSVVAGINPCTS
jgi:hypothetical protein